MSVDEWLTCAAEVAVRTLDQYLTTNGLHTVRTVTLYALTAVSQQIICMPSVCRRRRLE
jgi:hypothetical protein